MRMHFSKTLVAAAVVGAVASGLAGTASAYEYAMSHLLIQNFAFSGSPATPLSYAFDLRNTASLTGSVDVIKHAECSSIGTPCSTTGNVLDPPPAEIPVGIRGGNNNFAFVGPTGTYASSDSVIYQAQLVNGVPSSAEQIAEVDVAGNGTASGNAELQSNTTVNFGVVVTGNTFSLNFDADPDLRAAINDPPGGAHSALANLNTSFSFSSDTLDITISWAPQGSIFNNCVVSGADSAGVTCVETADSQDLNVHVQTGTNPSDQQYSYDTTNLLTHFGIDVAGLPSGTYSLGLNSVTSGTVVSRQGVVPEPASLALVGIGLLGLGVGLRRRSRG